MAKSLAPIEIELEGIGHVLRDRRLTVPPYQRAYSWQDEQVADFWWDLKAAFGSAASQYFLGTIVLTTEQGRTTIIDGQQRLATCSLLFTAIRNEFLRRGDPDRGQVIERDYVTIKELRSAKLLPRLTLNPDDRPHFADALSARPNSSGGDRRGPRDGSNLLLTALRFFEEQIEREAKAAGPHWAEKLFDWVDFLEHRARVIAVEVSDESDAFLIFETLNARGRELTVADLLKNYLFGVARNELDLLQHRWVAALDALEASAGEELFTTFVRHLWGSMEGATRERELYSRMKARITSSRAALEFGDNLAEAAPLYAALLSSDHEYWNSREPLVGVADSLGRLGLEQNRPLLLAAMRRFEPDEFGRLLRAVLAWSVRGLIVGGIGGGTTERAYGEAAVAVTHAAASNTNDVYELLQSVIPTDAAFKSVFRIKRINRTRLAKYLLLALAQHERGAEDPATVDESIDAAFDLQLVLPRNADPAVWEGFPDDEITQWALRLGNQFVVNDHALAPSFDPSVESGWSREAIERRQSELADLAVEVWPRRP